MNSFGDCRGSCHPSLSPPLAPPPIPGPCLHASASAPSVRANFLSELCSLLSTSNPNSIDLGPGKSEVPQQVSRPSLSALPFSLPRPIARWSGGAARRRSETKRMVALSRLFGPLFHEPRKNGRVAEATQGPPRCLQLRRLGAGRPGGNSGGGQGLRSRQVE